MVQPLQLLRSDSNTSIERTDADTYVQTQQQFIDRYTSHTLINFSQFFFSIVSKREQNGRSKLIGPVDHAFDFHFSGEKNKQ